MRDVLETLSHLPPVCAVWNDGAYLIKRGVMGQCEFPLATENDVLLFNQQHNVTPEQQRAMQNGCVFGWDAESTVNPEPGSVFVYTTTFIVMLSVEAPNEEAAAVIATQAAENAQVTASNMLSFAWDKQLDLIEKQDVSDQG